MARSLDPPKCGNCKHYRPHPQVIGAGQCWYGPPAVIAVMHNGAPSVTPQRVPVPFNEPPCGQWAPALEESKGRASNGEAETK